MWAREAVGGGLADTRRSKEEGVRAHGPIAVERKTKEAEEKWP